MVFIFGLKGLTNLITHSCYIYLFKGSLKAGVKRNIMRVMSFEVAMGSIRMVNIPNRKFIFRFQSILNNSNNN